MPQHRAHPPAARIQPCGDDTCHCRIWAPVVPSPHQGHPAEAWYSARINRSDYQIIHKPADDRNPALTGINIHDNRIRRVRQIRAAVGPEADQRTFLDGLIAWQAMNRLVKGS